MSSAQWAIFRVEKLTQVGWRCERCGDEDLPLEIHHKHYESFTQEGLNDVEALCFVCHIQADVERRLLKFLERNPGVVDRSERWIKPNDVLRSTSLIRVRGKSYRASPWLNSKLSPASIDRHLTSLFPQLRRLSTFALLNRYSSRTNARIQGIYRRCKVRFAKTGGAEWRARVKALESSKRLESIRGMIPSLSPDQLQRFEYKRIRRLLFFCMLDWRIVRRGLSIKQDRPHGDKSWNKRRAKTPTKKTIAQQIRDRVRPTINMQSIRSITKNVIKP